MQRTIDPSKKEELVGTLMQTMRTSAERLIEWVEADHEDGHDLEAEVRCLGQELCTQMLVGVAMALVPRYPASTIACRCGSQAEYQRRRAAQVRTLFGVVAYPRPYYLCAQCHQGGSPLDAELGWFSTGLQELTALRGGEHPLGETAEWIQRLLLIEVSPSFCQQVTEAVGQQILEADEAALVADEPTSPPVATHEELGEVGDVSMDGAMAAIRGEGWKEGRIGTVSTTAPRYTKRGLEPHAVKHSYVADGRGVGRTAGPRRRAAAARPRPANGGDRRWGAWDLESRSSLLASCYPDRRLVPCYRVHLGSRPCHLSPTGCLRSSLGYRSMYRVVGGAGRLGPRSLPPGEGLPSCSG